MDEQEFDALQGLRPFRTSDMKQFERVAALAGMLWGAGPDHIKRQLLAPHPEIPAGFELSDFHMLKRQSEMILATLDRKPLGLQWGSLRFTMDTKIQVGPQTFTFPEACYEIVRRAIEFLERGRSSG
jgi:hypothetical protein|nr:hypothetical protein [Candidatus Acidoferrales bacterium]